MVSAAGISEAGCASSPPVCLFRKELRHMVRLVCFLVFLYGLFNLFELVRAL
jgi:hypothetical protein